MLQGANTKAYNSECQYLLFPLQSQLKQVCANFYFYLNFILSLALMG